MSLLPLRHDSAVPAYKASTGDDYAHHSSYLRISTLFAAVLVTVGIAAFLIFTHQPPVSAGEVTQVWTHPIHTLNTPLDANGLPTAGQPYDQVLVLARVRLRNQSQQPIILTGMMTNVTLDDGPHSSYAATPTDYKRVFLAYPELASLRSNTFEQDTVIEPNEALDGMIVSAFHVSKEQWDTHKNLSFTFQFKMHPDLVLVPESPVIEK